MVYPLLVKLQFCDHILDKNVTFFVQNFLKFINVNRLKVGPFQSMSIPRGLPWAPLLKLIIFNLELSTIKIGELLRKLWSLRSCFLVLPPGTLTPQGLEGAMKRDVSKLWCTLQWCASRGWVIAHENWTSWLITRFSHSIYLLTFVAFPCAPYVY